MALTLAMHAFAAMVASPSRPPAQRHLAAEPLQQPVLHLIDQHGSMAPPCDSPPLGRRSALSLAAAAAAAVGSTPASFAAAGIELRLSESGLKWADLKPGDPSSASPQPGKAITIDYMMTKRAGAKIYSTKDSGLPFTWTLGDGTVIKGLELAVAGGPGIEPMKMGGVRRVMVPQVLGYGTNKGFFSDGTPTVVSDKLPVPPKGFEWRDKQGDVVNAYLRFKDIYMNEMRLDEPDLILDILLLPGRADSPPVVAEALPPQLPPPAPPPAPPPPALEVDAAPEPSGL